LLFGQGLGAYQIWSGRPLAAFTYISELTYLELLRNFGLIGAILMMGLLLFPTAIAVLSRRARDIAIAIAWSLYLFMCISNPNLFSSMGILILAVLMANIFLKRASEAGPAPRDIA
jgi:uncharacterized membrane protein YhaH (DUF805 family)